MPPLFKKKEREDRSEYLVSPMGGLIYVPKRRAVALLKRNPVDMNGRPAKYRKATAEDMKKLKLKEPRTNSDQDLIEPELDEE